MSDNVSVPMYWKRIGSMIVSILIALTLVYWAFVNQRWTSLALTCGICVSLFIPRIRLSKKRIFQLVVIWFLVSISPLEISFYSTKTGPKIARVVPGFVKSQATGDPVPIGVDSNGVYVFIGDVVGGMEPTWVIVW